MSRSTFPQKIDVFRELFDLPANQIANALELQRLKQKTTLTNDEQNQISALSAQLQDYMITPETMNKLQDAIVEIEIFFDGNVRKYILEKQKEWDTYVNDFDYVGEWDATKKFKKHNLITYQGALYIVTKDVVADRQHTPDNDSDHYRRASSKGDKGDIGLNAIFKGEWNGATSYKAGDAVSVREGQSWRPLDLVFIAKKDNQGQKPTIGAASDYWFPYHNLIVVPKEYANYKFHPDIHRIQIVD